MWFITGAARGIGRSIADAALQAGDLVVATTRKANDFIVHEEYSGQALTFPLDVSEMDQAVFDEAVQKAVERFGRIDVLVNNAGYGSITFFEETEEDTIKKQFEVNLFGLMRVTRAVLPLMRKKEADVLLILHRVPDILPTRRFIIRQSLP